MRLTVAATSDLETCIALRRTVFVEEQQVPEDLEVDGLDSEALHLLATLDGRPVGTTRLFAKGDTGKIGRVCVLREARGTGVGGALLAALIAEARRLGYHKLVLAAFPFNEAGMRLYRRFGFREVGVYQEQGVLDGRWVDTVIMELLLDGQPPPAGLA